MAKNPITNEPHFSSHPGHGSARRVAEEAAREYIAEAKLIATTVAHAPADIAHAVTKHLP